MTTSISLDILFVLFLRVSKLIHFFKILILMCIIIFSLI